MTPPRVVVIGAGNPYRRDDGAGREVARRLRARAPAGVEILDHDGEPVGLLALWEGADVVFLVDAVRSGAAPGTLHRIEVGPSGLRAGSRRDSSHGVSLGEAIGLARVLGRLPPRLVVLGVEAADVADGPGLTAPVASACGALADALGEEAAAAAGGRAPRGGAGAPSWGGNHTVGRR